jgi:hypothetical protein
MWLLQYCRLKRGGTSIPLAGEGGIEGVLSTRCRVNDVHMVWNNMPPVSLEARKIIGRCDLKGKIGKR